jgi:3-hydroxyacyl-[acyl-carrier-protein] dehydratase
MQTERADHTAHNDILSLVPQQYPFRFLDRILELDEQHIVGQYTFDPNLPFYQGHPGGSTPETILVETMAQTAVVALGLYLIERDRVQDPTQDPSLYTTLFTEAHVEFFKEVRPGETVTIHAAKEIWRRRKIRSKTHLYLSNGDLAAVATLSGMGVKKG